MKAPVSPTAARNVQFLIPFTPKAPLRRCPPFCQSAPAARWHPSPWRQLIASPELRGESDHLSILSSAYSDSRRRVSLFSSASLLCPRQSSFHVPPSRRSFSSKPLKAGGGRNPDRSCVLHRAGVGTRASEHRDITMAFPLTSIQI